MKRYDIVFEILHYMAIDATIKSVDYIVKNIDTDNRLIVITDNASPDGSGRELDEKYADDENVVVIHNSENEGFTRGNNFGIKYIRENCEFDFVVVMNNDVMLIETSLYSKLRRYYEEYDFAVAGPNVIDRYGAVSNPVAYELPSDKLLGERIAGPEKMMKYDKMHLMFLYSFISYSGFLIKRFLKGETKKDYVQDVCKDVVLQGSFWIFSNTFFKAFPHLADKKYMYGEEETLQLCVDRKGLTSLYMPDVTVLHMHAKASKAAFKDKAERLRFSSYNRSNTWKEYKELRDSFDKEKL